MTSPPPPILGVMLAGGRSQRMGRGDKCLALLAGKPLLAHAIDRLRPQVSALILNANGDPERFSAFGLAVVPDSVSGSVGPLAGILAGMLWARDNMPEIRHVAVVATDTPFIPPDLVARLRAALDDDHVIAIARYGDRAYPVFGLFPVVLAEDLEPFLRESPNRAVMAWLDRHRTAAVPFGPADDQSINPFFNINTPDDLAEAKEAWNASMTHGR